MSIKNINICHCGYSKEIHDTKFIHEPNIIINVIYNNGIFEVDANQYDSKSVVCCGKPECTLRKYFHDLPDIDHKYIESTKQVRYMNFCIPKDTKCSKCHIPLDKHDNEKHIFEIKIKYKNNTQNDVKKIINPFKQYDSNTMLIHEVI
jgi:hypothetical protein